MRMKTIIMNCIAECLIDFAEYVLSYYDITDPDKHSTISALADKWLKETE